jgi:hypothetical protein
MSIIFPAGSTCETYNYGWTSGCTDELGITRGFTQEWFFDGDLRAWVSVSKDPVQGGSGPTGATGSINIGEVLFDTSTHVSNTGPTTTSDAGTLRKFVVLADDGSLTFDYILTPDLVRPNDIGVEFTSFSWTARTTNDLDNTSSGNSSSITSPGRNGFTLCAPSTYVYKWDTGNDADTMFTFGIGNGPLNTDPVGITLAVQAKYINNYVTDQKVASQADLPLVISPSGTSDGDGTVEIQSNAVSIGISAGVGGPTYDLIKFEGIVQTDSSGTKVTKQDSNTLKTENEFFIFATGGDYSVNTTDGSPGVTGTNIRDISNQTSSIGKGITKLLPQGDAAQSNHIFDTDQTSEEDNIIVTRAQIGAVTGTEFIYVAFPTRCDLQRGDLYQNGSAFALPGGFEDADKKLLDITNAYGYSEQYTVFRSSQAVGLPNSDFMVKKSD